MKDTMSEKLEKIEYLNNKNIKYVETKFTGQIVVHWKEGEPMIEEEHKKRQINLE
jgi:hypothetical protein